jgi:WD40 repeat protein
VALSPNGKTLASESYDETINLWDWQTGIHLKIFRSERLYERMNISHAKGLIETQQATLKLLGAVEDEE